MKVVVHIVIVTTQFCDKSFSVLSLDENSIKFPTIEITDANRGVLYQECYNTILDLLKSVNELEILPQITTYHSPALGDEPGVLNMVFGYMVTHTEPSDGSYWFPIQYTDNKHKYIPTIFEVVQRLK